MKTLKRILTFFLAFTVMQVFAQKKSTLSLDFYADTYYSVFTDKSPGYQKYTTVSPLSNTIGLNVLQIGLDYSSKNIRSKGILHFGDIMNATWSSYAPFVQEANVGVHLYKDWWLDVGMFATHIGTESFLPKNNDLSSTTVATYNEPFYQGGAKLSYEGSEKYDLQFWVVNGYNLFLDNNSAKSVGLLFTYNFSKSLSLTYTNLFGRESTDGAKKQFRTYHNVYMNGQLTKKFKLTLGADVGTQTNSSLNSANSSATMFNALAILRYQITPKLSMTGRYEIFRDENGFISGFPIAISSKGLELDGYTLGMEYKPNKNSYIRAETRYISMANDLKPFLSDNNFIGNRTEFLVTMGTYFIKKLR